MKEPFCLSSINWTKKTYEGAILSLSRIKMPNGLFCLLKFVAVKFDYNILLERTLGLGGNNVHRLIPKLHLLINLFIPFVNRSTLSM